MFQITAVEYFVLNMKEHILKIFCFNYYCLLDLNFTYPKIKGLTLENVNQSLRREKGF
jgi:hypothetical protein